MTVQRLSRAAIFFASFILVVPAVNADQIIINEYTNAGVLIQALPVIPSGGAPCGDELLINTFCIADAFGAVTTADGQFTISGDSTTQNFGGFWGTSTLTATVTDVLGGANTINIEQDQDYQLAANFPVLVGFGFLNGNCTSAAGSSISGTVRLNNVVALPILTGGCPSPGFAVGPNAVLTGPLNLFDGGGNAEAFFDVGAAFVFSAGSAAGSIASIPIGLSDVPEPAALLLTGTGLIGLVFRRNKKV